jgi:glycosyltransferase involved in cell wall biosynthesis
MKKEKMYIFINMNRLGVFNDTSLNLFRQFTKLKTKSVYIEYLPPISQFSLINIILSILSFYKLNVKKFNDYLLISTTFMPPFYKISPKIAISYMRVISMLYFKNIYKIIYSLNKNKQEIVFIIFNPLIYFFIGNKLKNIGEIVYFVLDDWISIIRDDYIKNIIKEAEEQIIKDSSLIFVVSSKLKEKISQYQNKKIYIIPNGVDIDKFKSSSNNKFNYLKNPKDIIIGFVGTLDHWVDIDLIFEISYLYPQFKLIIAGKDNIGFKRRLGREKLDNLIYLGFVDYRYIPDLIEIFDVCINPFNNSEVAINSSPIKIYEYLAMKKPVITSYIKDVEENLSDYVFIAKNKNEFFKYLEEVIFKNKRKAEPHIEKFSWENKAKLMIKYLEEI